MSTFVINTIVVFIAAVVAFGFNLLLEYIKDKIASAKAQERNRKTVLMSLRTTKEILTAVKQKYNDNGFFDYVYIGQLENISKRLDEFRFREAFLNRASDQTDYFDAVSKIDLLVASMKSVQNYEYDESDKTGIEPKVKQAFLDKTKTALIVDLSSVSASIDSLTNKLEK